MVRRFLEINVQVQSDRGRKNQNYDKIRWQNCTSVCRWQKVNCTDMELRFIGHSNQSPMIKVNARWNKTDEKGNAILNEDKTAILTEGIKINC